MLAGTSAFYSFHIAIHSLKAFTFFSIVATLLYVFVELPSMSHMLLLKHVEALCITYFDIVAPGIFAYVF